MFEPLKITVSCVGGGEGVACVQAHQATRDFGTLLTFSSAYIPCKMHATILGSHGTWTKQLLYRDCWQRWLTLVPFSGLLRWHGTKIERQGKQSFVSKDVRTPRISKHELTNAMDFASVQLFSVAVTYLGLYLARKCETQQTSKQTVMQDYTFCCSFTENIHSLVSKLF